MNSTERFTQRQRDAWPEAMRALEGHDVEISRDPISYQWLIRWRDEVRPGRGHDIEAIGIDGEHLVQVTMDPYGSFRVSVAALDWIHGADEDGGCDACDLKAALTEVSA